MVRSWGPEVRRQRDTLHKGTEARGSIADGGNCKWFTLAAGGVRERAARETAAEMLMGVLHGGVVNSLLRHILNQETDMIGTVV